MTKMLEQDKRDQQIGMDDKEAQASRNYVVFGFFIVMFVALFVLFRWLMPSDGKTIAGLLVAAFFSAGWLYLKFSERN